jgi:hypothetical protein
MRRQGSATLAHGYRLSARDYVRYGVENPVLLQIEVRRLSCRLGRWPPSPSKELRPRKTRHCLRTRILTVLWDAPFQKHCETKEDRGGHSGLLVAYARPHFAPG